MRLRQPKHCLRSTKAHIAMQRPRHRSQPVTRSRLRMHSYVVHWDISPRRLNAPKFLPGMYLIGPGADKAYSARHEPTRWSKGHGDVEMLRHSSAPSRLEQLVALLSTLQPFHTLLVHLLSHLFIALLLLFGRAFVLDCLYAALHRTVSWSSLRLTVRI